uniref:Uncharacterized protein n=1 Tax=Parastrongyloides trichosuri TaxID=131310 RepID=A0A0N4ZF25_PARTI
MKLCLRYFEFYLKKFTFILILLIFFYLLNIFLKFTIKKDEVITIINEDTNIFDSQDEYILEENEVFVDINEPFFTPIPGTENINCNDYSKKENAIYARRYGFHRIKYKTSQEDSLDVSCKAIKERHFFPSEQFLTEEEKSYPLAYSTLVYKNYYQIELQLSLTYSIYNHYCFVIDSKSHNTFHKQINSLGSCFPNIYVMKKEFIFDSNGQNYAKGHLECLNFLSTKKWNYIFLLQNHDFPLKTNLQLVKILKLYNGASDFQMVPGYLSRIDSYNDWSFTNLNIFQKYNKNFNDGGYPYWLSFVKGFSEVTLSREDVDYMFRELNLTILLNELDYHKHGIDEMFWSTILSDRNINFPGGMVNFCTEMGIRVEYITRKSLWRTKRLCKSGLIRHEICIHGMEDFYKLVHYPHLFINKLMVEYDAGAVKCWSEVLWNKRFSNESNEIYEDYYKGTPHVKWRKCKLSNSCNENLSLCENDITIDDWKI